MEEFNNIHEMETILEALNNKNKLNERMKHLYTFILKSKFIVFKGYHSKYIILMFYQEVIDYFHKSEGEDCLVVDGKILKIKKLKTN